MQEITLIGLDLAKHIFRLNALNKHGKRIMNKNSERLSRSPERCKKACGDYFFK